MAKRGDGIGLEVSRDLVRGVRLASDEVGRVAAVCDVPIARFDDDAELFDALVRARGRLGHSDAPTRVAWFPAGTTLQRMEATGRSGPELNLLRHELADEYGMFSSMLVDADARRWLLALRWDGAQALRVQELAERAGFADVSIEPAPMALERVQQRGSTIARRDISENCSWAAVFDGRIPVAATVIEQGDREHPSITVAEGPLGVNRLDSMLAAAEFSEEVGRHVDDALGDVVSAGELEVHLRILDDPYPPFPAHDLRAPQRIGVALGAAVGAAGLAGRLLPVDVVTSVRHVAGLAERPWAIERLTDTPLELPKVRPSLLRRTLRRLRPRRRSASEPGTREIARVPPPTDR